jgi:hypothetical protein
VAITPENAVWFKAELFSTPTATPPAAVSVTTLTAVAPNPFNPRTTIHFELARPGRTRLDVFDLRGRRIRSLIDESVPAGPGQVSWDGKDEAGLDVASGVYVARLQLGELVVTRRMALVR